MVKEIAGCLCSLMLSFSVMSNEIALQGVWEGTLGDKQIVVCFNSDFPSGSYYYLQYLTPIRLVKLDDASAWEETAGLWKLGNPAANNIAGSWQAIKDLRVLPIRLRLIDGSDDPKACGRDSFNRRIENMPKLQLGKKKEFSKGQFYRSLRFLNQETLELYGNQPGIDKINAQLASALDQSKEAVDEFLKTRREFLGRLGEPASDERSTEITYWDNHWVSIRFYEWAAGTGRLGIAMNYRTWNLQSGDEVDLWEWLGSKSNAESDQGEMPEELWRFLFSRYKEPKECGNGFRGEGTFHLTLEETGMRFWEESFGDGCEKEALVPYKKLWTYLTPKGKEAVGRILNSRRF